MIDRSEAIRAARVVLRANRTGGCRDLHVRRLSCSGLTRVDGFSGAEVVACTSV